MTNTTPTQKVWTPGRLIYDIVRWAAAVISLLLFGLGLILAVPWKVTLVLSVIPAVTIFMPRDMQKWFWMVLAIVVITVYLWIRSPEQNASQWRPYVFEEKIAKYLYKGQIPDAQNAAIRYNELFARHEEDVFYRPVENDIELATYLQPWEETDQPELAQWMKTLEPDIAVLLDIVEMPDCHFTPPSDIKSLNEQLKRLNIHKAFIRAMIRSANQDIQNERHRQALQKEIAVLRTAQHLWRQKTLFDQAAGYFMERMGRRAMSRFIISVAGLQSLDQIEQEYQHLDSGWPKGWEKILTNEKMLAVGISGTFYQQNDQGHIRYSRNLAEGLRHHFGGRHSKYAMSSEMSRMIVLVLGFSLPARPENTAYLIEKRFDRLSEMARSGIDLETKVSERWWEDGMNASAAIDWYACKQVAYYYPLNSQDRQFEQNRTIIRILIALKRYRLEKGDWPDSLQQAFGQNPVPSDPVTQKPFMYQKQDSNFRLYGLGKNGIDDGGIKNSYAKPAQDDTLFWPPASISNEEEQEGLAVQSAK